MTTRVSAGKRSTARSSASVLAEKRGPWLKPFHCYFHNTQYRYMGLDLAEGCLYHCVYYYLQTYLNHGALVLFVNVDSLEDELGRAGGGLWISTGLLTDSLLAETALPVLPRISRLVPEGSLLELRTKSAGISCLEVSGHFTRTYRRIVVAEPPADRAKVRIRSRSCG